MSVLAEKSIRTRRPAARRRLRRGAGSPLAGRGSGPATLEEFVVGIWDGVDGNGQASCPICSGDRLGLSGCADCGAQLT